MFLTSQNQHRKEVSEKHMNRQIAISALSIVMALGLAVGGTLAYFTDTATSSNNTFTSGTLAIDIDQDDQTGGISPVISDWAPGDSVEVLFDVNNTGSLPVNLRGFALGTWVSGVTGDITPDPALVKVTKIEYWDGDSWEVIKNNNNGLTGEFYYSPNGNNTALFEIAAGDHEDFRLTVVLDGATSNNYQGASYEASITVDAKQIDAPWE